MNNTPEPDTLTTHEWQYISVLIANDIHSDKKAGINSLAAKHQRTWEKIQPACQWKADEDPE